MRSKTISVYIAAPPAAVYDFASNPANLPVWVPSFCKSVEFVNGHWIVQSPDGPTVFAFVEPNAYGVLDHSVTFSSGLRFTNPMRVMASGSGSELLFTLFQHEACRTGRSTEMRPTFKVTLKRCAGYWKANRDNVRASLQPEQTAEYATP